MGELAALPESVVYSIVPAQAEWLLALARGVDEEPVKPRATQTSIGVSLNIISYLDYSPIRVS